jgi:Uma2 family endonuclease
MTEIPERIKHMQTLHALKYAPEDTAYIGYEEASEKSEDGLYVSEEEYWKKYYDNPDFSYEWNNGYLEEKPMTDFKGSKVYQWFLVLLHQFLENFPIAKMTGLEFGFRLALPGKTTVRKPDLAVVLNSNPMILGDSDFSYRGTFDMCIESLSYSRLREIKRDTVEKKKEYQNIGIREYYILDARGLETAFYHLNNRGKYQKIRAVNDVIHSQVLPGFQFRISDLYAQPFQEKMAEDALYNSFVMPFHQKLKHIAELERKKAESEKRKALKAEKKAEQERRRADQISLQLIAEQQRAALLADKLKQLGISVE